MDEWLDRVRKAYDLTVEQFRNGIDPLASIPDEIKDSPFFKSIGEQKEYLNSASTDIREYLSPAPGMRFLDAGCSANLVNYRLDKWQSTYFGIDISPALIEAMRKFAEREQISIGGLEVADISELPFYDNFFSIASLIGVLEYCPIEYIETAIGELNRVLKPGAKAVIDIPNPDHPHVTYMQRLEEYLSRPIYIHPRAEFEEILTPLFSTERIDDSRVMIKYFVRTAK
ncbi:class I SAM-dependent methyltransferase [Chloroflexota bacterium]